MAEAVPEMHRTGGELVGRRRRDTFVVVQVRIEA